MTRRGIKTYINCENCTWVRGETIEEVNNLRKRRGSKICEVEPDLTPPVTVDDHPSYWCSSQSLRTLVNVVELRQASVIIICTEPMRIYRLRFTNWVGFVIKVFSDSLIWNTIQSRNFHHVIVTQRSIPCSFGVGVWNSAGGYAKLTVAQQYTYWLRSYLQSACALEVCLHLLYIECVL